MDLLCPASVKGTRLPGDAVGSGSGSTSSGQPLLQQLAARQAAQAPDSSSSPSSSSSLAEVELADGSKLQCRLLVAADGARSRIREYAGFRTVGWSYNQRGLVATVATAEPNGTAWQRFLPTGPLALLPVRDGYSNVVWTVTPEMARRLEGCSSQEFADAVNNALQQDPGTIRPGGAAGGGGDLGSAAGAVLQGLGSARSSAPVVGPMLGGAVASVAGGGAGGGGFGGGVGVVGAETGGSGTSTWRAPPMVQGWVGSSPKSFPLQLQHSGR